jgi:hypothetical protein
VSNIPSDWANIGGRENPIACRLYDMFVANFVHFLERSKLSDREEYLPGVVFLVRISNRTTGLQNCRSLRSMSLRGRNCMHCSTSSTTKEAYSRLGRRTSGCCMDA